MKVLVVDDSQAMRMIMRRTLEAMSSPPPTVIEAADGVQALERLLEHRSAPDLILLDWKMPNMDGLTLLKKIKASEHTRRIPVIMISVQADREEIVKAVKCGVRSYIVKPFEPAVLQRKVRALEEEISERRKRVASALTASAASPPEGDESDDPEVSFLHDLPDELVASLYERSETTEHGPGALLVRPDDVVGSLCMLDKGVIELSQRGDEAVREIRRAGECFGTVSFLSGAPAGFSARTLTEAVVSAVTRDRFEALIAEFPRLSFHLTRLVARRALAASSPKLAPDIGAGLSGQIETIGLAELVQTLMNGRQTGLLRLERGEERGELYFEDGSLQFAALGPDSGEETFYSLIGWDSGRFRFEPGAHDRPRSVETPTMALLMEGLRRRDEGTRGA